MGKSVGYKKPLKEKVVQLYELFFRGGDPSKGNPNFWNEFYLLKPNIKALHLEFENVPSSEFARHKIKPVCNSLFSECIDMLLNSNEIRVINSLVTLAGLVTGLFKCKKAGNTAFDKIEFLIGFENAEPQWQVLVERLNALLAVESSNPVKSAALHFLIVLITASEQISENFLLEYLMINSVLFESLIKLLGDTQTKSNHGFEVILIITIITNYRKYESTNPYIIKLSIVDNLVALNGYGQVLSHVFSDFNKGFNSHLPSEANAGFLSSLTKMVGSIFIAEDANYLKNIPKISMTALLALYEAVHLNRNFITTLTHSQTDSGGGSREIDSNGEVVPSEVDCTIPPSNLLVVFLESCSIFMMNVKDEASINTTKLCFIILTCICEDQLANSIMHDLNVLFKITLHQMPMRHRKVPKNKSGPSRSLAAALLDLMVEFVQSHMMKTLPVDLYMRALTIVHRLIGYQKKCRIRIPYSWTNLWSALINLLKFLLTNESDLIKEFNISFFMLCSKIVNIFNLFITFGDTFLPSPLSYDQLYYEIIRMHYVFDNLYSLALRFSTTDSSQLKDHASRLSGNLVNLRALINHYTPKIDSLMAESPSNLTEEKIMEIVRSNYDSLTLRLQDNLDQIERYTEKPREMSFFQNIMKGVIVEARQKVNLNASASLYTACSS